MRGKSGAQGPRRLEVGHEPMGDQGNAWDDDSDANSSSEEWKEGGSGGEGDVEGGAPRKGRRSTQRERLIDGMVTAATRDGYAGANVSRVITEASVSRPTFYEYFADRDDCFVAALADVQMRLLERANIAIENERPEFALKSAVGAVLDFAVHDPERARFLTGAAITAGPRALDVRDHGIVEIERLIQEAVRRAPSDARIPDLSPRVVIGGIQRLVATLMRKGETAIADLSNDLGPWITNFERPRKELRWDALQPAGGLAPLSVDVVMQPPESLPPGRTGLTREEIAANHRQRIRYAAAQLAEQKGYNATTVAEIARLAGVDGRAFYAVFADKQDAFLAAHEFGAEQVMAAVGAAFFAGATWPERVWSAGRLFASFVESNPLIAHVGFVEAYAVGPAAVQRIEDSHLAYTMFFQEGYQHEPRMGSPARIALFAIITTIFELVYLQTRAKATLDVSVTVGQMAFLTLAPFLGPDEAMRFIDLQR
jgi:AcrR family transcriptional regulator